MKIKASAPGKLILLGEYAVLEGAPALVVAVNRFAEVTLQTISSDYSCVTAQAIGISDLPFNMDEEGEVTFGKAASKKMRKKLSFFVATLEKIQSFFNRGNLSSSKFKIILDTSQFFIGENQKLGLGSSAALTVALFSALRKWQDNNFDFENAQDAFKASLEIHRKAQNNVGSGIDVAASAFGGLLRYQISSGDSNSPPISEKLTIPAELNILSIWTGDSASTTQFVQKVNKFKINKPSDFELIIGRMRQISVEGIRAIQQKNVSRFMDAVQKYYDEMKLLGQESKTPIISKIHQDIYNLIIGEGGTYKPSGAGGGDIGIAFCASIVIKERIIQKLAQNGFQIIDLELVNRGVKVKDL